MHYVIVRGWFGRRWKVYEMGHTEGDETWIASFRYEWLALSFLNWRDRVNDGN